MASPPLVSTYLQYRENINMVASCLCRTALDLGYSPDKLTNPLPSPESTPSQPQASKRLKGKARKEAKAKGKKVEEAPTIIKYIVANKDLISLAQYINSYESLHHIPDTFAIALNKCIAVQTSYCFEAGQDAKFNLLYITMLEKIRTILKPRMSTKAAYACDEPIDPKTLKDLLDILNLYEPPENDIEPLKDETIVFEAEPQEKVSDLLMVYYMLFYDMKKIQAELHGIWNEFRKNRFDIGVVAVTTNTAIEVARSIINGVLPALGDYDISDLATRLHIAFCRSNNYTFQEAVDPMATKHEAYEHANYTFLNAYRLLVTALSEQDTKRLPLYKPGKYGVYRPKNARKKLSNSRKFLEDKYLVNEMWNELAIASIIENYPVQDEMMRGVKEAIKNNEIPYYLVFATQVFLDINHYLRHHAPLIGLHVFGQLNKIANTVRSQLEFGTKHKSPAWPASSDHRLREHMRNAQWVVDDPVYRYKLKAYTKAGIQPPKKGIVKGHMVRLSPVLSGLLFYHFRFEMHEIGIHVINAWQTINTCWHLYLALKTELLITREWKDIEVCRSVLTEANFYVGDKPKNMQEYFDQFCLQKGVNPQTFLKTKHRVNKPDLSSGVHLIGDKNKILTAHTIFGNRYFRYKSGATSVVNWTKENVDEILCHSTTRYYTTQYVNPVEPTQKPRRDATKKLKKGELVHPDEFIESIGYALQAETSEFVFPWIIMHQITWDLLEKLTKKCRPVLLELFGEKYFEHEGDLPWVVGYALLAALPKEKGGLGDERLFMISGAVIDVFLRGAGDSVVRLGEMHLGLKINFAEAGSIAEQEKAVYGEDEEGLTGVEGQEEGGERSGLRDDEEGEEDDGGVSIRE
ncbi:hypothetical protein QBC38DRAFT_45279 [Podospora fimiseda]|uniref:DUF6604 domain-containing protein n=1 Tax=Podospora fimiseda TaxID=252190 RepID=A0AAN7BHW9_9PEZI|nr:hypothetical protein QBC38DRAFT_45279 [Podospora fimiseda]